MTLSACAKSRVAPIYDAKVGQTVLSSGKKQDEHPMSQTTTLIALARNEGPFLLEWVAYHRAIGFDRIVVLSDTSQDGTEALLDRLAAADAIIHVPKSRQTETEAKGFRARAYGHALNMDVVQSADWVMAELADLWQRGPCAVYQPDAAAPPDTCRPVRPCVV